MAHIGIAMVFGNIMSRFSRPLTRLVPPLFLPKPSPPQPESTQPRLKLTLRPVAETLVRGWHPWVYSESIRDQNREGESGELAVIYDCKDKLLALGFYDPDSPLRVRMLHIVETVHPQQRLPDRPVRRHRRTPARGRG